MNKLEHTTKSNSEALLDELYKIVPAAFTETLDSKTGEPRRAVDIDALRRLLGDDTVEGRSERYQFTWAGKREAMAEAARPINKTLRPQKEDSVDWDTTKNLYIEGDNLEVLKLLQKSYYGQVKMIYIDPPYNTGNDFVYDDDFSRSADVEAQAAGDVDEYGNKLRKNTDSNGRFHSDWCSMIYPRLMLARNLLREDGVIFISIDDNEVENMRKICDEVFGEYNFIADLIWANKEGGGSSDSRLFRIKHEHILCFAKRIEHIDIKGVPISNQDRYKGKDEHFDIRGPYYLQKLGMGSIQYSESLDYEISCPDGSVIKPADNNGGKKACWRWSKEKFIRNSAKGFVEIKKDSNNIWTVYTKQYMNCDNDGNIIKRTQRPMGIIEEYSSTQAAKLLRNMSVPFDYSKPIELISYLIDRCSFNDSIILDFFSGSATTAHAVMQLNAEDGGNRRFIMVQLPELTDEKSEAYKAGYKNICEIGKERIRRAGAKIKSEHPDATNLDTGFRVFRVADSNFGDVRIDPSKIGQLTLDLDVYRDNIKSDRSGLDLLYGSFLSWGVPLDEDIKTENIDGEELFIVREGYLVALFGTKVTDAIMDRIAELDPQRILFRDATFSSDEEKINVYETLKQRLGWTEDDAESNIRVL